MWQYFEPRSLYKPCTQAFEVHICVYNPCICTRLNLTIRNPFARSVVINKIDNAILSPLCLCNCTVCHHILTSYCSRRPSVNSFVRDTCQVTCQFPINGHAMAQMVGRWPCTAEARGQHHVALCGFCGGQSHWDKYFSEISSFSLTVLFHYCSILIHPCVVDAMWSSVWRRHAHRSLLVDMYRMLLLFKMCRNV